MLGQGGKGAWAITSLMAGHPTIFEQDFHRAGGHTDIDVVFYKLKGHAVKVAINLDMIIDIHLGLFPFGIFKGASGKPFEGWPVQVFKQGPAGGVEFVKLAPVELDQLCSDGLVEFGQAEELVVSQSGQDPALGT